MYSSYFTTRNSYGSGGTTRSNQLNMRDLVEVMRAYNSNFSTYQSNMTQIIDCLTNIASSQATASMQYADSANNTTNANSSTQQSTFGGTAGGGGGSAANYVSIFDLLRGHFDEPTTQTEQSPGLSLESILANTTILTYSREQHSETETCPITLDAFVEGEPIYKINGCGHIFKSAALLRWFSTHRVCPMCRREP